MKWTLVLLIGLVMIGYGCSQPGDSSMSGSVLITGLEAEGSWEDKIDVADHDTIHDCFMVIDGRVYDLTDFFKNSPEFKRTIDMSADSFRERLSQACGTDGTIVFRELFGENHLRIDSYLIDDR